MKLSEAPESTSAKCDSSGETPSVTSNRREEEEEREEEERNRVSYTSAMLSSACARARNIPSGE